MIYSFCDAPKPWGLYFQDSASPQMEAIIELHNNIMFYLFAILFSVGWILLSIVRNYVSYNSIISNKYLNHGKIVPTRKCSKFDYYLLNYKVYTTIRYYSTSPKKKGGLCSVGLKFKPTILTSSTKPPLAKFYEDAFYMKNTILEENKGKSGVYMLTNKITADIYIGQSLDISKRFKNYFNIRYLKGGVCSVGLSGGFVEIITKYLFQQTPYKPTIPRSSTNPPGSEGVNSKNVINDSSKAEMQSNILQPNTDFLKLYTNNYNEYIKMFWVGLMDGDGSIQINHWRKQSLQYRLVIKLSNIISNYNMLINIAKVIGGTVRVTGKDVIWVVNSKKEIENIIKIFDFYPPLTSKKICQLAYLKTCLTNGSVEIYLSTRNLKYEKQSTIISSNIDFKVPSYFSIWLSGFIEAEGCFSIRKSKNNSFSIGQNDDFYLLEAIKQYFEATNKIRNPYTNFYSLEIYKKETLSRVISHCTNYPLLGEKLESFIKFKKIIIK